VIKWIRTRPQWQLFVIAATAGIIFGSCLTIVGLFGALRLATYLAHGKTTELGDAVLSIYVFLISSATGFIAGFSGTYGVARRRILPPVLITLLALAINILGFFVPTGGHALLPFYFSLFTGLGLTAVFLIPRQRKDTHTGGS